MVKRFITNDKQLGTEIVNLEEFGRSLKISTRNNHQALRVISCPSCRGDYLTVQRTDRAVCECGKKFLTKERWCEEVNPKSKRVENVIFPKLRPWKGSTNTIRKVIRIPQRRGMIWGFQKEYARKKALADLKLFRDLRAAYIFHASEETVDCYVFQPKDFPLTGPEVKGHMLFGIKNMDRMNIVTSQVVADSNKNYIESRNDIVDFLEGFGEDEDIYTILIFKDMAHASGIYFDLTALCNVILEARDIPEVYDAAAIYRKWLEVPVSNTEALQAVRNVIHLKEPFRKEYRYGSAKYIQKTVLIHASNLNNITICDNAGTASLQENCYKKHG